MANKEAAFSRELSAGIALDALGKGDGDADGEGGTICSHRHTARSATSVMYPCLSVRQGEEPRPCHKAFV